MQEFIVIQVRRDGTHGGGLNEFAPPSNQVQQRLNLIPPEVEFGPRNPSSYSCSISTEKQGLTRL